MKINLVRKLFGAALGAVILSCGDASHPTGPGNESGLKVSTDEITSEGSGGPVIATDKADYLPGDTVTITGTGWQANETITMVLTEEPAVHDPSQWMISADSLGSFTDRSFLIEPEHLGVSFTLVATGAASADTAQGTFTDGDLKVKTNIGPLVDAARIDWLHYSASANCTAGSSTNHPNYAIGKTEQTIVPTFSTTQGVLFTMVSSPGLAFKRWVWSSGDSPLTSFCFLGTNQNRTVTAEFAYLTSTSVTADLASPQTAGTDVTFAATVSFVFDGSAVSAGKVSLYDGGTCTSPGAALVTDQNLPASGIVSVTTGALSAGAHTVLACYAGATVSGDSIRNSSGSLPFTINPASVATSTSVGATPTSPSEFGTAVTFTATVTQTTGGAAVTTGNVSFHDASCAGTELQAAAAVNGSGVKTYVTSALAVGSHTVVACYEGATGFDASNGSAAYTIDKIATGTAVTTNLSSPQNVGAAVTFTATVTRTTGGAAVTIGSVRFIEGGTCAAPTTTLQSATAVNGSGQVTFSGSSLAAGAHSVVACYDGDTNYGISEGSKAFTFDLASSATNVTASPSSPREFGTSVTFTAAVTSGGNAVLGGNVRFIEGGSCSSPTATLQAATAVDGSGEVDYTTTTLAVGAHTVVACYDGSGSYDTSNGSIAYTINKISTSTGVTANVLSPQESGASVTFTAEVNKTTGGSDVTSGSVAFYDGGSCTTPGTTLQAATAVDGSGKVTLTTAALSIGNHTILACYGGTSTYATSDGSMAFEISKILTTTSVTALPASPQEFGTSVTFTAEVNRTTGGANVTSGSVAFYDGGSCTTPGTSLQSASAVDGDGKATLATSSLNAATHTIVACYGGNSTYEASGDDISYVITPVATATGVSGSPNPSVTGQSVTFTATVTMHAGADAVTTGAVTFRIGGTDCTTGTSFSGPTNVNSSGQATGSRAFNATETGATIRACYANADANYDPSNGSTTQTVNKAATSATISSNNNSSEFGENVTLSSTVAATAPGSGAPSGTVSFYEFTGAQSCTSLGAAAAIGSGAISAGNASATINSLSVGTHVLTACYEGDSNFLVSQSSTLSQVVDPVVTGMVLTLSPNSQQYSDTTYLSLAITPHTVLSQELTGDAYFYAGASPMACGTSAPAGSVANLQISAAENGVDSVAYRISKPAGSYTLTSCFYSSNSSFANSNDTEALTVNVENAVIYDVTTPDNVQVGSGGTATPSFTLKVKDKYPETNLTRSGPGNIDSATVTASGKGVLNPGYSANFNCVKGTSSNSGYSRYAPWTCTAASGLPADTYEVTIIVDKDAPRFYEDTTTAVIQVTDPSLGFATGGGWYLNSDGDKVNFGFMAKATVNNRKTVYQGSLLSILHKANGDEVRIKSNVFDGYSIGAGTQSNMVTFSGKANYSVNGISDGNYAFTGYGQDNGTPGTGVDKFGVYLARPSNEIATSSTLANLTTTARTIGGGNIQVPQPSRK